MAHFINNITLPARNLFFYFFIFLFFNPFTFRSQTTLTAGDMLVIAYASNQSGSASDPDFIDLLVLKEMSCGTTFVVTDNGWDTSLNPDNWNASCGGNAEGAVEYTCQTVITAGSVIRVPWKPQQTCTVTPWGSISTSIIGGAWGTDDGFNNGGDNVFVLQGNIRNSSSVFICGLKNNGLYSGAGNCTNKDNSNLPVTLSLGPSTTASAVNWSSGVAYRQYRCGILDLATKGALTNAITNTATTNWNTTICTNTFVVTDAPYSPTGVLFITGAGCGCAANCNLSSMGGPNCGSGVLGSCASQTVSVNITLPVGTCTNYVTATIRPWPGISSNCGTGSGPGADAADKLRVDVLGGVKPLLSGAGDGVLNDSYTIVGGGTVQVVGVVDRADEIVAYRVLSSPCAGCNFVLPIELKKFNGELQDKNVLLRWTTTTESKNDYFTVERSANASEWKGIAVIQGYGDSKSEINYSVLDISPLTAISYYRLKQTDVDGTFTYSKIISIDNKSNDEDRKIIKRVNIYGQELDENATGLMILIYDNGDVKKIFKN